VHWLGLKEKEIEWRKRNGGERKFFSDFNTHAVLRISGCTLYSLAKTNGTIPWGRAAYIFFDIQDNKQTCQLQFQIFLVQQQTSYEFSLSVLRSQFS